MIHQFCVLPKHVSIGISVTYGTEVLKLSTP